MNSDPESIQPASLHHAFSAFKDSFAWATGREQSWIILGSDREFVRLNLLTGQKTFIQSPTLAHSFLALKKDTSFVIGLEKWGRNLSAVDFERGKLIRSIQPEGHRLFFGHVCWTNDQKRFISPQMDLSTCKGYLVWYDRETLKIDDEVEFRPGGSHDLGFLPGTDILAITSSGLALEAARPELGPAVRVSSSALSFFDAKSRRIVREWSMTDPSTFPGHLKIDSNGHVYFVTSMFGRYGGSPKSVAGSIYDASLDHPISEWLIPDTVKETLNGELLSIEISEKQNRLTVTNPTSKQLLTYDLKERKFLGSTSTASPGIAWDQNHGELYGFEYGYAVRGLEKLDGYNYRRLASLGMSSHILLI